MLLLVLHTICGEYIETNEYKRHPERQMELEYLIRIIMNRILVLFRLYFESPPNLSRLTFRVD